jgi:tripartite-type tricarboxylate transporter receptor subunit TctC
LGTNSILVYQPLVNSGLAWKTSNDYQPIVKLIELPNVLSVRADAPWKTFEEFMADVRKNPGKIRVSVPALRTGSDLDMQQFNKLAGVKLVTIPFTGGSGEATVALLGGRVEAQAGPGISNLGLVQVGKLRALAVFKKGKYEPYPDATPVYKTGYDGSLPSLYCVIAPKGMPKDVLDNLVTASLQVLRSEEWIKFAKARGGSSGGDVNGPEVLKAEFDQYSKLYDEINKYIDSSKAMAPK